MNVKILHKALLILFGILLMAGVSNAQNIKVSGIVKSGSDKLALPGVIVKVKGASTGTLTDLDGKYALEVTKGNTIVYSFIGFDSKEIEVIDGSEINIELVEKSNQLDDIIVIGYGTQKKKDMTGSVSVVNTSEMKKLSTSDMTQILQGSAAGVQVTSDGQPGAAPDVKIRGFSTFGISAPLYVIDGVVMEGSPRDFSPNDIESMQILKDAASGAIYGSKASNGVIIITTKHGNKNQALKVEYTGYYGVDKVNKKIAVTDRIGYQTLMNETLRNAGKPILSGNDPNSPLYITDVDTDWQKESFKEGNRQSHAINLSGGSTNSTYNVALDYYKGTGTLVGAGPNYEKYTSRINLQTEKGILKIGASLFYAHSDEDGLTNTGGIMAGGRPAMIADMLIAIPTMPLYDATKDGGFGGTVQATQNAISLNVPGVNSLVKNSTVVDRFLANVWAEATLLPGLKYKINSSFNKTFAADKFFVPTYNLGYFFVNTKSILDVSQRVYFSKMLDNTLTYNTKLGANNLELLAGHAIQSNGSTYMSGRSEQILPAYTVLSQGGNQIAKGALEGDYMVSFFGRLNYGYDDRYLLQATIRRDASSKFSPTDKWGTYPSVALGWKLHNEKFFKLPSFINELKLRASYGVLGNQNSSNYTYQGVITSSIPYNFDGAKVFGATSTRVTADIKWESKTTSNVGFDASFLGGAIDWSLEYYKSTATDIIVAVPIPNTTGADNSPLVNAGSIQNSGIETTASYHKHKGDFTFDVTLNFTTLKNKVLALGGNKEPIYGIGAKTEVGSEVGQFFGLKTDGIFQTQAEVEAMNASAKAKNPANGSYQSPNTAAGDIRFVDTNGDGVVTSKDRVYLGSAIPTMYYGINFSCQYKNFDFSISAAGQGGNLIQSSLYRGLMHTNGYHNYSTEMLNRWTPTNPSNTIPRVVLDDPNGNDQDSDREGWLQNGTFLRINTMTLGYNLPKNLIKGIASARFYVTGQNLYSFQHYNMYNPDFTSGVFNPGFDGGSYPRPVTALVGLQVSF